MKTINLILIIAIISLVALMIYGAQKQKISGSVTKGDFFEGYVTNQKLSPGERLEGNGVYDKSCNPVENGLTQCDAGIQTEKGLLNFNYKHFMHSQPCISEGDKLIVEVSEGGKTKVTRI